jgi:hypothetical protein
MFARGIFPAGFRMFIRSFSTALFGLFCPVYPWSFPKRTYRTSPGRMPLSRFSYRFRLIQRTAALAFPGRLASPPFSD